MPVLPRVRQRREALATAVLPYVLSMCAVTNPQRGFQSARITDPDELRSLSSLLTRLEQVPNAISRWDRVAAATASPRSELSLDDEYTAWRNLSHSAVHQLNHAADALNTLTLLITADEKRSIPFVSHYAVARTGLEAASLALWVLAPADPRERVSRHLRNAWREVSEEAQLSSAVLQAVERDAALLPLQSLDKGRKETRAWKRKHTQQIRNCARRLALPDPTESRWTLGFAEVVREASIVVGLPGIYGEAVWRELSGLSHPSLVRATRSMRSDVFDEASDGTLRTLMSTDSAKAKYCIEATYLHFRAAVDMLAARKIRVADRAAYASPRDQPAHRP